MSASKLKISHKVSDTQAKEIEITTGTTLYDLAQSLNLKGPEQACAAFVNGHGKDFDYVLHAGDTVRFFDFADPEGKEVFWHTSAHLLAQAVLRLWPEAKPTIGPPGEAGFFYDFAGIALSDADFERLENEMQAVVKENFRPKRMEFASREAALERFKDNPYKQELIHGFAEGPFSGYTQGEFFDLCRGPHLSNIGKIKALKITKTSGAYWKGDAKNEMLTRIYGITFPDRKLLLEYNKAQEEAKKRDHKILGPKLGLFSLKDEAPGIPFIHPRGAVVWNALLNWWRELHAEAGYEEIKTPHMMTKDLWVTSGHWANYRENMYTTEVEDREFAIKPMNCPGCMLYFKSDRHSYRELPLRLAEIGLVHRYEASGALSGLLRVRSFHQDDAHIFMTQDQIESEIFGVMKLADTIYTKLGLDYRIELSTRPEKNTIGSDADWEVATKSLQNALEKGGRPFRLNPGDGAFYGPKIDLHVRDALGRTWQCGTIQLDMSLPERFELEYTAQDGAAKRPIMIHRALFGSIERFFGILIEHFAGRFPLWLSPQHVQLMPVADRHIDYSYEIHKKLKAAGLVSGVDESAESIGKKVRNAQLMQINYMLTIGDSEVEKKTISVRTRDGQQIADMQLDDFVAAVVKEKNERAATSPFAKQE